ncbi:hypothetical protein ACFWUQ_02515 [Streptomyces sp. NPDC058662]|uniref:hypothetical protein n=1 Tax=Streptomyces sp. NPDC058662 TaxID=3346583 RepID=UPI003653DEAE
MFKLLNTSISDCVEGGRAFEGCRAIGVLKYPPPGDTPVDWIGGKLSQLASDALEEAARYVGRGVVWLLGEFARLFNRVSTIDLEKGGVEEVTAVMVTLSVTVAVFLMLLQFGKASVSHRGEPLATAFVGLAKWAVISSVYTIATQTALKWSDAVSDWIVNEAIGAPARTGGGKSAAEAMEARLGSLFGGLVAEGGAAAAGDGGDGGVLVSGEGFSAPAVGVVIVVGIVCIVAIGALWVEILLRQAGIMLLVAAMPIVLAGQLSDATADWWPRARNALIALILMKPAIVTCFFLGIAAMSEDGVGMQNVLVGLVTFLLSCFCWPVLVRFLTFTTAGSANGIGSTFGSLRAAGLYPAAGGGYRAELAGAGSVGGGSAYTRALEQEAQPAPTGPDPAGKGDGGGRSRFAGRSASARSFAVPAGTAPGAARTPAQPHDPALAPVPVPEPAPAPAPVPEPAPTPPHGYRPAPGERPYPAQRPQQPLPHPRPAPADGVPRGGVT